MPVKSISIVIPTYNGAGRIWRCLDALVPQLKGWDAEVLVIDDGSRDHTAEVVGGYASWDGSPVKLVRQENAGPAAARNNGARLAKGEILLFTDDDCVPQAGWLEAMLEPFGDPEVVGAKGIYRTLQPELVARFVQLDYEDRYRLMAETPSIDFIDTYSAAFVREKFLEAGGYDTSFPVACAEDVELSFRMSARGWVMKFAPDAVVTHTHPDSLGNYLKKKYKFAYWRVVAVKKNPSKGVKDSHTPQVMKAQLLFLPVLGAAVVFDIARKSAGKRAGATAAVLGAFALSTIPFTRRAVEKDALVGMLSPVLLALRASAQFLGVAAGSMYALQNGVKAESAVEEIEEEIEHAVV